MLDDISRVAFHSPYEAAFRAALLMIAVALFIMLAIRLAMSFASIARVKARKQWAVEPPVGKHESLMGRLLRGEVDESKQQALFTDEVRQMLAHAAAAKNPTATISR
jgi:hypothetical protein